MEIPVTTTDIPILVKMKIAGVLTTLVNHQNQYGTPATIQYTLKGRQLNKKETVSINYTLAQSTSDALYFLLPKSMLDTPGVVWIMTLQFAMDTITDHALSTFEIKVTKPEGVSRV